MVVLDVFTLVVALAALGCAVLALRTVRAGVRREGPDALPEDVLGLRQEVAALRAEGRDALRHLAAVRYDGGNGVVLTSIHGRSEARTYAKSVSAWRCDQQLSPEETEAIEAARP